MFVCVSLCVRAYGCVLGCVRECLCARARACVCVYLDSREEGEGAVGRSREQSRLLSERLLGCS